MDSLSRKQSLSPRRAVAGALSLLVLGFMLGAVSQRYYGLGNIRRFFFPESADEPECAVPEELRGRLHIFLLAGQSNMEGGGRLSEYSPLDTQGCVYVFDKEAFRWNVAREPLDGRMVGPAVSFACALRAKDPALCIGLVPCARGGTNIAQWSRNLSDHSLYGRLLMRAKAASAMGRIEGLLFMQGENDTEGKPEDHPYEWRDFFERFVEDVRMDLGISDLPVIFAQIGANPGEGGPWEVIKRQQADVRMPSCAMTRTDDLAYNEGEIHLSTASQMVLGRRFADAFWALRKRGTQSPSPSASKRVARPPATVGSRFRGGPASSRP